MSNISLKELTGNFKTAYININHALNWIIGGLENTLQDFPEDSEEYASAMADLTDHEGLVNYIYQEAITGIYGPGFCSVSRPLDIQQIRLCGKAWLMEVTEQLVKEAGY